MDLITPNFGLIFWTTVVFTIVLLILKKYAWKPILKGLNDREKSIADALIEAQKARSEMQNLKADNEKLLNEAREERQKILKEAKTTSDGMINEAKDKARIEAGKIVDDARREIEAQKVAAISEVKNQAGKLALEVAEKILQKELENQKAQEDYVNNLVENFKLN